MHGGGEAFIIVGDMEPVSEKQIWAVVLSHPETFVKSEGRIRLIIDSI